MEEKDLFKLDGGLSIFDHMNNLSSHGIYTHESEAITQDTLTEFFAKHNRIAEDLWIAEKYAPRIPKILFCGEDLQGEDTLVIDFNNPSDPPGIGVKGPMFTIYFKYPPGFKYPGNDYNILAELIIKGIKYNKVRLSSGSLGNKPPIRPIYSVYKELDTKEKIWQVFGRILEEFPESFCKGQADFSKENIWALGLTSSLLTLNIDDSIIRDSLLYFIGRAYNSSLVPALLQ